MTTDFYFMNKTKKVYYTTSCSMSYRNYNHEFIIEIIMEVIKRFKWDTDDEIYMNSIYGTEKFETKYSELILSIKNENIENINKIINEDTLMLDYNILKLIKLCNNISIIKLLLEKVDIVENFEYMNINERYYSFDVLDEYLVDKIFPKKIIN